MFKILTGVCVNAFLWAGCREIHSSWVVFSILMINSISVLLPIYRQLWTSSGTPQAQRWRYSREDAVDFLIYHFLMMSSAFLFTWVTYQPGQIPWSSISLLLSFIGTLMSFLAHKTPKPEGLPVAEEPKRG